MPGHMSHNAIVPWVVAGAASLVAALIDVRRRRIPNWLTGPLLLGGIVWSIWMARATGLGDSLLGALIAGGPFIVVWLIGGGGAGDAKMMLGLGAWLGWRPAIVMLLAVALAGGMLSLGYAIAQRRVQAALLGTGGAFFSLYEAVTHPNRMPDPPERIPTLNGTRSVPYGVAIFGGVCAAAAWVILCGI